MKRAATLDAERVRLEILRFVKDHNIDSEVLARALADITGATAAALDQHFGHIPFDTRMEAFLERAKDSYQRTAAKIIEQAPRRAAGVSQLQQ